MQISVDFEVHNFVSGSWMKAGRFYAARPYHIYQALHSGRIWLKVNFKRSLTGLNSEFSFSKTSCFNKAEEPSLPYYLPIAGGRIIGFIPFS